MKQPNIYSKIISLDLSKLRDPKELTQYERQFLKNLRQMLNKSDSIISQGTNIIPASKETKHTKHDKSADIDAACSCLLKNNPSNSIIENQQNNHMISDNNKGKQIYMNLENKCHSTNIAKELQTENPIINSI